MVKEKHKKLVEKVLHFISQGKGRRWNLKKKCKNQVRVE